MTELEQAWLRCWRMAHSDNQENLKRLIDRRVAIILPSPDLVVFDTIKGSRIGLAPLRPSPTPSKSRRVQIARRVPYAIRRASISACLNFAYC